jgi:hypothetical protein
MGEMRGKRGRKTCKMEEIYESEINLTRINK